MEQSVKGGSKREAAKADPMEADHPVTIGLQVGTASIPLGAHGYKGLT